MILLRIFGYLLIAVGAPLPLLNCEIKFLPQSTLVDAAVIGALSLVLIWLGRTVIYMAKQTK